MPKFEPVQKTSRPEFGTYRKKSASSSSSESDSPERKGSKNKKGLNMTGIRTGISDLGNTINRLAQRVFKPKTKNDPKLTSFSKPNVPIGKFTKDWI